MAKIEKGGLRNIGEGLHKIGGLGILCSCPLTTAY